jgi:O-acetyl-ADP-ribose deacetylase (regulator of RNase III)
MIHAVVGDLAFVTADAVARPATTLLEPLTPALRRFDEVAGPRFEEQRRLSRALPPGSAVVTSAGALGTEIVVHLVLGDEPDAVSADTVRKAMEAALWQCTQWQISTLACPVPPGETLAAMLEALRGHMRNADFPANVLIVTESSEEADTLNARLGQGRH